MKKIRSLLDFSKLKYMFQKNIQNPMDLSNFLNKFQNILELTELNEDNKRISSSHKEVIKRLFLIQIEILPFYYLYEGEISNMENVIEEFLNGKIGIPKKSLYDNLFRIYNQYEHKYIVSYKDIENINSEIYRILTDIDAEDLLNFFKEQNLINFDVEEINKNLTTETKILSIEENLISEEFLYINNNLPNMIITDRILIYSALLNYSYSEIMSTENYKNMLSNKLKNNNIPSNWDDIRIIFIEFLKELSKRTINY